MDADGPYKCPTISVGGSTDGTTACKAAGVSPKRVRLTPHRQSAGDARLEGSPAFTRI